MIESGFKYECHETIIRLPKEKIKLFQRLNDGIKDNNMDLPDGDFASLIAQVFPLYDGKGEVHSVLLKIVQLDREDSLAVAAFSKPGETHEDENFAMSAREEFGDVGVIEYTGTGCKITIDGKEFTVAQEVVQAVVDIHNNRFKAGLEAAAKVCDEFAAGYSEHLNNAPMCVDSDYAKQEIIKKFSYKRVASKRCAEDIRKLKDGE